MLLVDRGIKFLNCWHPHLVSQFQLGLLIYFMLLMIEINCRSILSFSVNLTILLIFPYFLFQ